ncbi:DUF3224 domain-containing protein [Janthinobacterium sp. SUN118]|uniref:DUF3224 domain-containing protein n=1 Tax=Janthinobacterium sp. SUN118 TaxID=3004100 RepID=UPI0025AF5C05|nr:DUF3224 domain-containing protein [Janthinobacterium sp. SUN118]MDN2709081.1 DUF3224 domain-containing protein [Janthinobacterium sp. SUN118]
MKSYSWSGLMLAACCLSVAPAGAASSTGGDHRMHAHATGSFSITMAPAVAPQRSGRTTLGRVLLDKVYAGDLVATATGEMLNAVTDTKGAAGYVAMEAIAGVLQGREGSFVAQHAGTMADGKQQLAIVIVPHSGTGQLTGISGTLAIRIENGQHFYDIDYTLPE